MNESKRFLKILVVDDEKQVLKAIQRTLSKKYDVDTATTGIEALLFLKKERYFVVISDYKLENQNGVDLLKTISLNYPCITRIAITGYQSLDIIEDAVNKASVFKFITKPWEDEKLLLDVQEAVELSKVMYNNMNLLEDIENKNRDIYNVATDIKKNFDSKKQLLNKTENVVDNYKLKLNIINNMLMNLSDSQNLREVITAITNSVGLMVNKQYIKTVTITKNNDFTIYEHNKKDKLFLLDKHKSFLDIMNTIKRNNFIPLHLDSIHISEENKLLFFNDISVSSVLFFPISLSSVNCEITDFVIVLGRTSAESFNNDDIEKIRDVSNFLQVALERSLVSLSVNTGLKQWHDAFEAIKDPLIIIDDKYKILRLNSAVNQYLSEARVEELCYVVLANKTKPCEGCKIYSNHEKTFDNISCLSDRFVSLAYPIYEGNKVNSVILYHRDTLVEKDLYKKLVQSEKLAAIGMLAFNIAHELNNPLGGILAYSQLLQKTKHKELENEQIQEDLKEIEKGCNRTKKIISNLMAFSKETPSENREKSSVEDIIEGTLPLLHVCLKAHKTEINIESDLYISCNISQIQQVLFNLITNATHAIEGSGVVSVNANHINDKAYISISDNGKGVPDEIKERIFDPYFTTKSKTKGTGLGLAISNKIILAHNGKINVESKENIGTTFTIELPLQVI